ncbi:iron-containing alcohol dehydrogenase [Enterocloster clostridioformis]|uniref:Uncharacterized protein n=1 Tax=[Clostridium] clostridioforme 90A8 TaxID=999408 RepID=A0A0E2H8R4_9FIRM|nr:iron-containing alcohol dehydrogenase [Enterocloster clostridioformis]ENZ13070.1 hypothetical protein HMPREF1090_03351 [[Clostridium] clostridioforme 90A8]MCF2705231.1 iron-containing alcohol dehydrogenase [Enterocloster clostridioformis]
MAITNGFELVLNRRLIFGENRIEEVIPILEWYKKKKALFVTFSMHSEASKKVSSLLQDAGLSAVTYEVTSEPTLQIIDNGRDIYLSENCDCTIGLGGGSVIDTAKVIGMLAVNGGSTEDYQLNGRAVITEPPLFIAIPTTSGTGAEATKTSVVINNNNHLKKSLYHNTMIADIVILDPTLTLALPARITAATGMDALSHAIESYVSLNANPVTEIYGLKAIELVNQYLEEAYLHPDNIEARSGMMLASYLGGCAISAGIGIAHIMAQPLGGEYGIPHGDACSIFLPGSIILNQDYAMNKYIDISRAFGVYKSEMSDEKNIELLLKKIANLQASIEAPHSLKGYLKTEPDMDYLIDVIQRTTGHITCNPRPLTKQLMKDAYVLAIKE